MRGGLYPFIPRIQQSRFRPRLSRVQNLHRADGSIGGQCDGLKCACAEGGAEMPFWIMLFDQMDRPGRARDPRRAAGFGLGRFEALAGDGRGLLSVLMRGRASAGASSSTSTARRRTPTSPPRCDRARAAARPRPSRATRRPTAAHRARARSGAAEAATCGDAEAARGPAARRPPLAFAPPSLPSLSRPPVPVDAGGEACPFNRGIAGGENALRVALAVTGRGPRAGGPGVARDVGPTGPCGSNQ